MTWNIHGAIGPDRRFDIDRVAALVGKHEPDIVALQEIDTRGRDPRCLAPLHGLHGDDCGHHAFAHTITGPDGAYGNALFSRWPLAGVVRHDLSVGRREPRSALAAVVETPFGPLRIVAVHLGLSLPERAEQGRRLAAIIGEPADGPTVALGDFNDWFAFGSVRRRLAKLLPGRTLEATFPAPYPKLRLDRIYCAPAAMLGEAWTDLDARYASDHLPVIADLHYPA